MRDEAIYWRERDGVSQYPCRADRKNTGPTLLAKLEHSMQEANANQHVAMTPCGIDRQNSRDK